jgi:hypothetical protein
MTAPLLTLRSAPSGALFEGVNNGDTLLWDAAHRKWTVGPGGGGGAVDSVFGRTGDVLAETGDYDSDQVTNVSTVTGSSVSDALENLQGEIDMGGLVPPAGQIGGDTANPTCIGLTSSTDEQLPYGEIDEGTFLRRVMGAVRGVNIETNDVTSDVILEGDSLSNVLLELQNEIPFAPIESTRYVDLASTVTPANGSERAPFASFDDLWTEIGGQGGNWRVYLPTGLNDPGTLPAMAGGAYVIFIGLSGNLDASTGLGSLHLDAGNTLLTLELRELRCEAVVLPDGAEINIVGNRLSLDAAIAGTAHGKITAYDSEIDGLTLPLHDLKLFSSRIGSSCSVRSAELHDVEINTGVTLQCADTQLSRFWDVRFGTGVTLDLGANGVVEFDTYSWWSFVDAGVTLAGAGAAYVIKPAFPFFGIFDPDAVNIGGSSVATIGLGAATPPAKPGGQAIASLRNSVNTNFVVIGAQIDGSGNIQVAVRNLAITTQSFNEVIQVSYELLGSP